LTWVTREPGPGRKLSTGQGFVRAMNDRECIEFLQWALPHMRLRWSGYRKVRRLVCKRIDRRCRVLGMEDVGAYRRHLQAGGSEWEELRALCSVPISRFFRDREVFASLENAVLPALAAAAMARADRTLACWSAGCASGEEPYSLAILWWLRFARRYPALSFRVLATDCDPIMLERAALGCYGWSSLKEVPEAWRAQAFEQRDGTYCVREPARSAVEFARQDLTRAVPDRRFDLILCRNIVLTYFDPQLQREVMQRIAGALHPGGALVVGVHETLPEGIGDLVPWPGARAVYRSSREQAAR
jgi:chemotaxis protein methyltransferase CheR